MELSLLFHGDLVCLFDCSLLHLGQILVQVLLVLLRWLAHQLFIFELGPWPKVTINVTGVVISVPLSLVFRSNLVVLKDCFVPCLVTNSILFCCLFSIEERCKKVRFLQTHNQGLRQLLLTVSWDLRA